MVKEKIFSFGTVTEKMKIPISFDWEGEKSDIDYIKPSCSGCTQVWYDDKTKKIKGVLDLTVLSEIATKGPTVITKFIDVELDPHQKKWVGNVLKQRVSNKKKRPPIKLQVSGRVVLG